MRIHQFRCWPSREAEEADYINLSAAIAFTGKNILKDDVNGTAYAKIKQIGIQGAPGTVFWINDAQNSYSTEAKKGITLNWTGIFELDLTDLGGEINSLAFSIDSKELYLGSDKENYKLIIDILYEDGGVK